MDTALPLSGARPPTVGATAQPYTAGMPTPQRRMKNTFARPSNWNPAPAVHLSIQMDLLFVPASRLQLRLADGESLLGVNSVRSAATDYPTIYGSAIRSPATRKAPSIAGCLTWWCWKVFFLTGWFSRPAIGIPNHLKCRLGQWFEIKGLHGQRKRTNPHF